MSNNSEKQRNLMTSILIFRNVPIANNFDKLNDMWQVGWTLVNSLSLYGIFLLVWVNKKKNIDLFKIH